MNGDLKQHVNMNSAEFKQGVEAGLNSADDTKNWQAGNKLRQEQEGENKTMASENLFEAPTLPLFLRDSSEHNREENPQDEKDETEE